MKKKAIIMSVAGSLLFALVMCMALTPESEYRKIGEAVVSGFNRMTDDFVDQYLTREGESVEDAKKRLAEEQAARVETAKETARNAAEKRPAAYPADSATDIGRASVDASLEMSRESVEASLEIFRASVEAGKNAGKH